MTQEFEQFEAIARALIRQYSRPIKVAIVVVVLLWASNSMFYKVEADSKGVVLRLGKLSTQTPPGLHFKLPWPIDKAYTVPVAKVQSEEFGRTTVKAGRRTEYTQSRDDPIMARMLTGDLNLAHVEWVVNYRISDAAKYLFKIGGERGIGHANNARDLIRDVSESVMRQLVGDVSVDSVITTGRQRIETNAKQRMQAELDRFESGIQISAVKLKSATPPDKVKDAFDAVNRAKQSKERVVNEAKGERNRLIPAARGKRDRTIAEAEGYAIRVQKEANGNAKAFLAKLNEYNKAPEVTKLRLYLEAMEEVLQQVDDKIIIDESIKGVLPLLHLGQPAQISSQSGGARRNSRGGA